MSSQDSVVGDEPLAAHASPSLRELRLVGLLATLVFCAVSLFLLWTALQSVFIALQVQRIAPNDAAGGLAFVIGLGAIGALVSAPIAGALSDRTRTPIGGRTPWMIAGAVLTFACCVALSRATSIMDIAVCWLLIQISTNLIFTPLTVHIPERVPLQRRGIFSAAIGLSNLFGVLLGQVLGAAFAETLLIGYVIVSVLLVAAVVTFAVVNRASNVGVPKSAFRWIDILKAFWVNPIKHPAFGWTFLGRLLFLTGFFPLKVYLLYILQDYIGLGANAVSNLPPIALAGMAGGAVGSLLAGWLSDRLGVTRPLIFVCSGVMIAAIAIPLAAPTLTGMIAYSFLVGAGFGGFASVDYVLITKVLPSQGEAGKDLGIINMTTTLSQTLGVGLAGFMVSVLHNYAVLFASGIVFILLGSICVALIKGVR